MSSHRAFFSEKKTSRYGILDLSWMFLSQNCFFRGLYHYFYCFIQSQTESVMQSFYWFCLPGIRGHSPGNFFPNKCLLIAILDSSWTFLSLMWFSFYFYCYFNASIEAQTESVVESFYWFCLPGIRGHSLGNFFPNNWLLIAILDSSWTFLLHLLRFLVLVSLLWWV